MGNNLDYVLENLARKPNTYILHAYDVGEPTNYEADYVWQILGKEKQFDLKQKGKLGLINYKTDISYFFGFADSGGPILFNFKSETENHLINLWQERVHISGHMEGRLSFIPITSASILAAIEIENRSGQDRDIEIYQVASKEIVEGNPRQKYLKIPPVKNGCGPQAFITTGKPLERTLDRKKNVLFAYFEEVRARAGTEERELSDYEKLGYLQAALSSNIPAEKTFACKELESIFREDFPFEHFGTAHKLTVKAHQSATALFCIFMHRFSDRQVLISGEFEFDLNLYPVESRVEASRPRLLDEPVLPRRSSYF